MHESQLAALMQAPPVFDPNGPMSVNNIGIIAVQGSKFYMSGSVVRRIMNKIFGPMGWGYVDAHTGRAPRFVNDATDLLVWTRTRDPHTKETVWSHQFGMGTGTARNDNQEQNKNARYTATTYALKDAVKDLGRVFGHLEIGMGKYKYPGNNVSQLLTANDGNPPGQTWASMTWPDPSVWWRPGPGEGNLTFTRQHPELFGGAGDIEPASPYDQPDIIVPAVTTKSAPVEIPEPSINQPVPVTNPTPVPATAAAWGGPAPKTVDQELAELGEMRNGELRQLASNVANHLFGKGVMQLTDASEKRKVIDTIKVGCEEANLDLGSASMEFIFGAVKAKLGVK